MHIIIFGGMAMLPARQTMNIITGLTISDIVYEGVNISSQFRRIFMFNQQGGYKKYITSHKRQRRNKKIDDNYI